jgi:putative tricarboxylic transport membrane protein
VPQRHVEFTVPGGAGGSLDGTSRTVHRLWQDLKLLPVSSSVVNRAGGEHAVGYTYVRQRAGDPHHVGLVTSVLLTGHIEGRIPFTYTDVTPIAFLVTEYIAFAVRTDSPLKTGRDFVEALKKSPDSLSIGLASTTYRMALGFPLQAAGIEIKPVKMVVSTGGAAIIQTLGGHVDVSVGPVTTAIPHVASGKLRVIAMSSPKRMGGALASAPTWEELGFRGKMGSWRGMIAPRDITSAQVAFWENVLRRVVESEEFRKSAERNQWDATFKGAAETRSFMEAEYKELKSVMTYLGLAKQ